METPTSPSNHPTADLPLPPERWALIRPKLESLLAELSKMEELEAWELEPDTADAWGAMTIASAGGGSRER
jgi:hypothetical protein